MGPFTKSLLPWKVSGRVPALRCFSFCKTLHLHCLTVFWIRLYLDNYLVICTLTFGDIQLLRHHKMIKIWIPLPPCLNLFKFGSPIPILERSQLNLNLLSFPPPLPPPLTKTVNFVILWFYSLLPSAPVNATKNIPWTFSKFIRIQMVLIISDGLRISLLILTKFKRMD